MIKDPVLPADIPRDCKESTGGIRVGAQGPAPGSALGVLFAPVSWTWQQAGLPSPAPALPGQSHKAIAQTWVLQDQGLRFNRGFSLLCGFFWFWFGLVFVKGGT